MQHAGSQSAVIPVNAEALYNSEAGQSICLGRAKDLIMSATKSARAHTIAIQRAYDDPAADDGYRVLVDRFWPRGRSKAVLKLDEWARDLAPTAELIGWFGHDPARWEEFRRRYRAELAAPAQHERLQALLLAAGKQRITLVYGARSETENQAVVLREILERNDRSN
jgi:uncharacterized protein YeaO (DUF488 family)